MFVNSEHTYNTRDLLKALHPKIQIDDVLAGHDYHKNYPDVVRAVLEVLGVENMRSVDSCFYYTLLSHV